MLALPLLLRNEVKYKWLIHLAGYVLVTFSAYYLGSIKTSLSLAIKQAN